MPAIKLTAFGGMVPAMDDRLLPDDMSSDAENAWLYTGTLEGIRDSQIVHTVSDQNTKRVFRIPKKFVDREHIVDSYWLEFPYKDVDVVRAPMDNDSFKRYYWAGDAENGYFPPRYNTLDRIASGSAPYILGIPTPEVAPVVSTVPSKYSLTARTALVSVTGGLAELYYTTRYGYDANTFANGLPPPGESNFPLKINGNNAVLKRKTSSSTDRVTVADDGTLTHGVPFRTPNPLDPGTGDPTKILVSRAYLYTWVSAYGEEGPPSPPALLNAYQDDPWYIRLTAPTSSDTTDRNLTKVRIYRTVTASTGVATYFLVDELPISQTSYTDEKTDVAVSANDQLASTNWTAPPTDLKGIASLPNGMFVGFRENEIWFSEPYRPHAWPSLYTLSVDYKIVGLGVIGQTAIVCTQAGLYAATGLNPISVTLATIDHSEPCLSRGSIVSTQSGVVFASPNGLILVSPAGAANTTAKLFTKDKWLKLLKLDVLRGAALGNAYYCFGSVALGVFQENAFQSTAFELTDFTGSREGGLIDLTDQRMAFVRLSSDEPHYSIFNDPWTDEVLSLREGTVHWINIDSSRPRGEYTWTSKRFQTPNRRNLEAMKIYFDNPENVTDLGTIKVYADDRLVMTRPISGSGVQMRMPSGFRADFWQVKITSKVVVSSLQMATSAKELALV